MFLLDTHIVSELRKPKPHESVLAWIGQLSDAALYLSAVTIGEIQAGIEIAKSFKVPLLNLFAKRSSAR